jgi:hypothetical protein
MIFADPSLIPLTDNGVSTNIPVPEARSLALDAGDNAICAAYPVNVLDQRDWHDL